MDHLFSMITHSFLLNFFGNIIIRRLVGDYREIIATQSIFILFDPSCLAITVTIFWREGLLAEV